MEKAVTDIELVGHKGIWRVRFPKLMDIVKKPSWKKMLCVTFGVLTLSKGKYKSNNICEGRGIRMI